MYNVVTFSLNFTEWCVALNFINNFGLPFKLFSSLKHEGNFITGPGFRPKLIIKRPELHSHVTFNAVDITGRELFLNGQTSVSEPAFLGCPVFLEVDVTSSLVGNFGCRD